MRVCVESNPASREPVAKRLVLEIERNEGEICRFGDGASDSSLRFHCLRSRKIHLEDAHVRERIAVRECIEARAQNT